MPKYNYLCETCGERIDDWEHPISECDEPHLCSDGHDMHRVPAFREAFFWGPDFSCNSSVALANVGRNPTNQNRYSKK